MSDVFIFLLTFGSFFCCYIYFSILTAVRHRSPFRCRAQVLKSEKGEVLLRGCANTLRWNTQPWNRTATTQSVYFCFDVEITIRPAPFSFPMQSPGAQVRERGSAPKGCANTLRWNTQPWNRAATTQTVHFCFDVEMTTRPAPFSLFLLILFLLILSLSILFLLFILFFFLFLFLFFYYFLSIFIFMYFPMQSPGAADGIHCWQEQKLGARWAKY